ncbi:MAG: S4 domain-containing protein [Flavobacteriaceae bacterium]
MRIDSFLWCIRVFKSRNSASQACKKGNVKINGKVIKPSREVLPLDQLKIRKEQVWKSYEIIALPKSRVGAKIVPLYAIDKTSPEEIAHLEFQHLAPSVKRDRGTGRPTKKERREIDELLENKENLMEDL